MSIKVDGPQLPEVIEARTQGVAARAESRRQALAARVAVGYDEHVKAWRRYSALDLIGRSWQCGDEVVTQVVVATIERVIAGDLAIVHLEATEGKGLTKVVRAKGLGARLLGKGFAPELVQVALRFVRDFDKARIGGLTSSYGQLGGGGAGNESERFMIAIDLLSKATSWLERDQRVALYGVALMDVSFADMGAMICGHSVADKNLKLFTGKLYLRKALERLMDFYCEWDLRGENVPIRRKMG